MMMTRLKKSAVAIAIGVAFAGGAQAAPLFADIVTIVDESGSMAGEHAWLAGMASALDSGLNTAGLTPNLFGLVGFGGATTHLAGHQHDVGGAGSQFGTAAEFGTATGSLVLNGGTEDGYSGMTTAFGYTFRAGAAKNFILVTDEDRDDLGGGETTASMLAALRRTSTLLNAVVDVDLRCGDGSVALGLTSGGTGYKEDGAGGFTTCTGASAIGGFGTTITDYVDLAIASGGAAWDLNQLRTGGLTATSFTAAFVDLKVTEIQQQLPEPASMALLGIGLAGMGFFARKRKAS